MSRHWNITRKKPGKLLKYNLGPMVLDNKPPTLHTQRMHLNFARSRRKPSSWYSSCSLLYSVGIFVYFRPLHLLSYKVEQKITDQIKLNPRKSRYYLSVGQVGVSIHKSDLGISIVLYLVFL